MSNPDLVSDDQPPAHRTAVGRLRLIAATTGVLAVLGFASLHTAWYRFDASGTRAANASYSWRDVSAKDTISGVGIVRQTSGVTISAPGAMIVNDTTPTGMLGMPVAGALLLAAAGLILAGVMLRMSIPCLVAAGPVLLGYKALSKLTSIMEDPAQGGQFNQRLIGHGLFQLTIGGMGLMVVASSFMVLTLNAKARAERKARGETEYGIGELIRNTAITGLIRAGQTAEQMQTRQ